VRPVLPWFAGRARDGDAERRGSSATQLRIDAVDGAHVGRHERLDAVAQAPCHLPPASSRPTTQPRSSVRSERPVSDQGHILRTTCRPTRVLDDITRHRETEALVPTHHLVLFTLETWQEFIKHGAAVTGFREGRWSRVQQIEEGDLLLCYVIGLKRWIGVLEVSGPPFFSAEPPIWASDPFPSRLPVRMLLQLTPETGVPQRELIDRMPMFSTLGDPQREWGGHFLGSPRLWPEEDARVVMAAIEQAHAHPVTRPIGRIPRSSPRVRAEESEAFGAVVVPDDDDEEVPAQDDGAEVSQHGEVQATLIELGAAMGYRVFLARNDRSRMVDGQRLGDRAAVIEHLPLAFDAATTRIVELIDVIWLNETVSLPRSKWRARRPCTAGY
jgi:hypothetical protein